MILLSQRGGDAEARIVGEDAKILVERRDIEDAGPDRAGTDRQLRFLPLARSTSSNLLSVMLCSFLECGGVGFAQAQLQRYMVRGRNQGSAN